MFTSWRCEFPPCVFKNYNPLTVGVIVGLTNWTKLDITESFEHWKHFLLLVFNHQ